MPHRSRSRKHNQHHNRKHKPNHNYLKHIHVLHAVVDEIPDLGLDLLLPVDDPVLARFPRLPVVAEEVDDVIVLILHLEDAGALHMMIIVDQVHLEVGLHQTVDGVLRLANEVQFGKPLPSLTRKTINRVS
jgi:hypothetical protein